MRVETEDRKRYRERRARRVVEKQKVTLRRKRKMGGIIRTWER